MTAPGLVGVFVGTITPYDAATVAAHLKALADPARLELLAIITSAGNQGISGIGAVEAMGLKPRLVRGDARNVKVTYPEDLALAELILNSRKD